MPGLTPEAKVLAFSEGCPRQIIKYTPKVYGFQCYFEFTLEAIEGVIENSTKELAKAKDLPYVQGKKELLTNNYDSVNQLLFNFLDKFTT
jgi:GMP synthase (glutamine-hydrolysing)